MIMHMESGIDWPVNTLIKCTIRIRHGVHRIVQQVLGKPTAQADRLLVNRMEHACMHLVSRVCMQPCDVCAWQEAGGMLGQPDKNAGMPMINQANDRHELGTHDKHAGICWASLATGRHVIGKN